MSLTALLPASLAKEVHPLALPWLASALTIAAAAVVGQLAGDGLLRAGYLAYVLGAVTLGGLAVGHEYSHRTLALLLCQPRRRARMLLSKIIVLTPMLVGLAALAWSVLFDSAAVGGRNSSGAVGPGTPALVMAPLMCGLFVAPAFTMMARSALAGVVFTLAVPASLWLGGDLLGVLRFGLDPVKPEDVLAFKLSLLSSGLPVVCAISGVATWWLFMRLEAIDGHASMPLHGWRRLRAAPPLAGGLSARLRTRHPAWALVRKELRLQQATFMLSALYVLAWATTWAVGTTADGQESWFVGVTVLHGGVVAMLIGSIASAEERGLGTLEWQTLLPWSAAKQWLVKAGTALGLTAILAMGLPLLLALVMPLAATIRFIRRARPSSWR